jgi:hypothetical protein
MAFGPRHPCRTQRELAFGPQDPWTQRHFRHSVHGIRVSCFILYPMYYVIRFNKAIRNSVKNNNWMRIIGLSAVLNAVKNNNWMRIIGLSAVLNGLSADLRLLSVFSTTQIWVKVKVGQQKTRCVLIRENLTFRANLQNPLSKRIN